MKLTKHQINEVLNKISADNRTYGLIFKLQYIYAKKLTEIISLKKEDLDFTNNTIKLGDITYPIHKSILFDLRYLSENKSEIIFTEFQNTDNCRDILNTYLYSNCPRLKGLYYLKKNRLTTRDFRILRGQHLYQDGVPLHVLQELYNHKSITSTEKIVNYTEPQDNINSIFEDLTDLNIFKQWDYDTTYYCQYNNNEAIIETNESRLNIIGDNTIKQLLKNIDLKKELDCLKDIGEYKFINKVKILKN